MAETKALCSKCGKQPPASNHTYCKACKAEYQREYTEGIEARVSERAAREGWAAGAEAFRAAVVGEFRKSPAAGLVQCGEVARYISSFTAPPYRATE